MKKEEKGFSLVELMIVVLLSSVVAYGLAAILRGGNSQAQVVGTRATIQESARDAMIHMLQEIRESAPSRIVVAPSSVSFQIPSSIDANGNIVWSGTLSYALGGTGNTQLLRTDSNGTVNVMANDVQAVSFTGNQGSNPTLVTVQIDMQRSTLEGRPYTETLRGEAKLRNV